MVADLYSASPPPGYCEQEAADSGGLSMLRSFNSMACTAMVNDSLSGRTRHFNLGENPTFLFWFDKYPRCSRSPRESCCRLVTPLRVLFANWGCSTWGQGSPERRIIGERLLRTIDSVQNSLINCGMCITWKERTSHRKMRLALKSRWFWTTSELLHIT